MLRLAAIEPMPVAGRSDNLMAHPPRLVTRAPAGPAPGRPEDPVPRAVELLCEAVVSGAPGQGLEQVRRLMACGIDIETVFETLIPRTAARLGTLWLDDALSFTAVTIGTARLTEVFRALSPAFQRGRAPAGRAGRALFALVPGEQHALGVVLAADFFQRAGWAVQVELQADADTLVTLARSQPFGLVGLSAGSRRMLPALPALIARLRAASGPDTRLLLGGALVAGEPGIAAAVGADLAAANAQDALCEMEQAG